MFDVGLMEMLVIGVVALIVLGPERLPKAARKLGFYVRKARQSWHSVRAEFERELATEELKRSVKASELTQSLQEAKQALQESVSDVRDEFKQGEAALRAAAQAKPLLEPMPLETDPEWDSVRSDARRQIGRAPSEAELAAQPVEALLPEIVVASNVDAPQTTPSIQEVTDPSPSVTKQAATP
ncbi:MAG: Sec-independent protein translocase protein TatB [Alphaproteobacteria bacterium ADurb.BinA280]|jgi:sec-independent protein translocase protein TatB|nr:twin-arginine translocase subunit TatB [Aquimonas sp.]OPZ12720.1 MAG: Sec-independent protein translocase protein TatB [Alphaproteobacteria bacterium ADurb.BinA280]